MTIYARSLHRAVYGTLLAASLTLIPHGFAQAPGPRLIPALVSGDEPIVVTTHHIKTATGILNYEARAGRLALRNDETGEIHGYAFFVAYTVAPRAGKVRPLTFLWNGGPTANAILVHTEVFGPRRFTAAGMADNAETLLADSDLVFFDPIETGFSRPARPEFAAEFLSTLGDFAETAEFVRAFRARFGAEHQPLFLGGESYGTWRVSGATELLTKRGIKVSGAILISGGVPGSLMPGAFQDAMYVPARTATAFVLGKLPPDLMKDRARTMKMVDDWAYNVYMPALGHVKEMTLADRDQVVLELARYTGVRPEQINRTTLVMTNKDYKAGLFAGDKDKVLNTYDMRIVGNEAPVPHREQILADYLRLELGFHTDLAYSGLEDGYMPLPGPARRSTAEQWKYNHVEVTPEAARRLSEGGGPPLSQPWLQNAMRLDPALKVFVAAGRYDSLNMCEGNVRMSAKLEPALATRFTHACYEGGHMMYRVQETRLKLSQDIARFIREAISRP